jgi:hypothetical protein
MVAYAEKKVICVCRGELLAETPQRYCRNCGHQLSPQEQFCPKCGAAVHLAATVPTPEADVPVPPPPQTTGGAGGAAIPQQRAQEGGEGRRRNPIVVGCLGVFALLAVTIIMAFISIGHNEIKNPLTGGILIFNFGHCQIGDRGESPAEQKGPKGKIGQTVKFSNVAWRVTAARRATVLKAPNTRKKKGNVVIVDYTRKKQGLRAPAPYTRKKKGNVVIVDYTRKKRGNFVIVDFLFTNYADEATTLSPSSLTLLDSEGCEFKPNPDDFVYIAPGKNLFSSYESDIPTDTKVGPGVTQDGEAIFTVAPDAKDFTLRAGDTDPFISDENAYIELGF